MRWVGRREGGWGVKKKKIERGKKTKNGKFCSGEKKKKIKKLLKQGKRAAGEGRGGGSPWRRSRRWCPRPCRTWRGRAGLWRGCGGAGGGAGRTMPRWLCASQWGLTRRHGPSYRAGGGARAAPRRAHWPRAPRPPAPIGRRANNGHGRLKRQAPGPADTAAMSSGPVSAWAEARGGGRRSSALFSFPPPFALPPPPPPPPRPAV